MNIPVAVSVAEVILEVGLLVVVILVVAILAGGDTGGGTVIGGGSGEVVPAARPGTTVVKNAAQDAVASVIKSYGNSEAACNVGVQLAFKNIFGSSNLPPGMVGKANEMAQAWRDNPKHWQAIPLGVAISNANHGFLWWRGI